MLIKTLLAVGSIAFVGADAWAGSPARMDTAAAAAAFGNREKIISASISPDGDKVALVLPGVGQSTVVAVLDLKTGDAKPINVADGNPMTLTKCNWASEDRIVCSLYGVSNANYNQWLGYQRLIALDADGNNPMPLGIIQMAQQYASMSDGHVIDWRDGKTPSVLIARNYVPGKGFGLSSGGSTLEGLGVDLLDTRTGKATKVESPDPGAQEYIADGNGNIRIMAIDTMLKNQGETRGITTFRYRLAGQSDWKPFSTYNGVTNEGLVPIAVDGGANVAYALKKVDGRDSLYRVSLDGSLRTELALSNPKVDIGGVVTAGRHGRVVGATFIDDKPEVVYFDQRYQQIAAGLAKALPSTPLIWIINANAAEDVFLVYAASDTNAGRYFVFNSTAKKLTPIGESRPDLAGVTLGKMQPITYKAADGTDIPAYLTVPPGSSGKNLPTIIMPHGGPASRDVWGFDWLVQFFVNRGYAVLQPNYRGSAGYGQDWFKDNGFRSWKIAIGDVNDAARWAIAQGIADPSKLAIVGWSYGGYAALQSQVLDPKLYKAVVAIAPVTDLNMLRGESRGFTNSKIMLDYIGEGSQLKEGSPLQHTDAFIAPVLLFHGEKDINVGVDESKAMAKALSKSGKKVELVVFPKIDHQLDDSAVRTQMLAKADAFLAKALGM